MLEKTSGFFPALSAFIKNKEESKDAALGAAMEKELDNLDEIVRSTPGQYVISEDGLSFAMAICVCHGYHISH